MDLGNLSDLKEMAVAPSSVFRMKLYPEDGVVPKNASDESRNKYFVILGKDENDDFIALSLINININENLKLRIGAYQHQIKSSDYAFLNGTNRYVDCYDIKEIKKEKVMESATYEGFLNQEDMDAVIKLANKSPIISDAKLKQYQIFKR